SVGGRGGEGEREGGGPALARVGRQRGGAVERGEQAGEERVAAAGRERTADVERAVPGAPVGSDEDGALLAGGDDGRRGVEVQRGAAGAGQLVQRERGVARVVATGQGVRLVAVDLDEIRRRVERGGERRAGLVDRDPRAGRAQTRDDVRCVGRRD